MGKALVIIALVFGAIVGIGMTMLGTSLMGGIDEQTKIIIAIVISFFSALSFYFLTKSHGG